MRELQHLNVLTKSGEQFNALLRDSNALSISHQRSMKNVAVAEAKSFSAILIDHDTAGVHVAG